MYWKKLLHIWQELKLRTRNIIRVLCFLFALIIFYYFHNDIYNIIDSIIVLILGINWNMITALSTVLAAILAYCAYRHSKKMRQQSSFDAVFTQLLSNLQNVINNPFLICTQIRKDCNKSDTLCEDLDVFMNFCNIYKSSAESKAYQKFDENEIVVLWSTFTDSLEHKSKFLNCFKYIYHMVNEVLNSTLDEPAKQRYIGIIQAQLNIDVLFCYLINQIAASQGFDSFYCQQLKKYDFFKNIFEDSSGYGKCIKTTIPVYIYEHFTEKK